MHVAGTKLLVGSGSLDGEGRATSGIGLPVGLTSGFELFAQLSTTDGSTGGDLLASSPGLALTTF